MEKLTNDERQFITDNFNLVYKYICDRNLDKDEWLGLLSEKFCHVVKNFKNDGNKLSVYLYKVFDNTVSTQKRLNMSLKRTLPDGEMFYHLDDITTTANTDGMGIKNDELVGSYDENIGFMFMNESLEELYERLTKREKEVFMLLFYGYSLSEIGDVCGFTRERARTLKNSIKRKWVLLKNEND
jgi:RNA polymerase sigma factor (sigma-70 family)